MNFFERRGSHEENQGMSSGAQDSSLRKVIELIPECKALSLTSKNAQLLSTWTLDDL